MRPSMSSEKREETEISSIPILKQKPSQADTTHSKEGHTHHCGHCTHDHHKGELHYGHIHPDIHRLPHHDKIKGRHKKALKRTVILRAPLKDDAGPWVKPKHEATEWLSLFYDLVVVAVLTVFSTAHELSAPKAIPAFFSYFVIIYWIWVSQTHYDTRYQSDDALHFLMKFCQISVYIYIGAASGKWAPGKLPHVPSLEIFTSDNQSTAQSTEAEEIQESFKTVVCAYLASRCMLAVQYAICAWQGSRAGRRIKNFWISTATLLVSAALSLTAVLLPLETEGNAIAKITLFYSGMALEIVVFFVQIYLNWHISAPSHKVTERYGAFTLILLGEGFIALTRALKLAISGLSDRDTTTYAQVFLAILIMYLLWGFLFGRFDKEDQVSHRRQLAWEIIHFPLAFSLLMLFGAIVNTVLVVASATGTTLVLTNFDSFLQQAVTGNFTAFNTRRASRYLDKLSLQPTFETEIAILREMALSSDPAQNATIVALQYYGQIVIQAINTYGLETDENIQHAYDELNAVNTTQTNNITYMDSQVTIAAELTADIINESFNEFLSGVQWLLPMAGIVLLLCAIRSLLWYRFRGPGHFIIHGFQIAAGVILSLLGLLNIGNKQGNYAQLDLEAEQILNNVNPMYRLTMSGVPLVVVMGFYLVTYLGSTCAMTCLHWRKGGVYQDENEDDEHEHDHAHDHDHEAGVTGIEGTRIHHG